MEWYYAGEGDEQIGPVYTTEMIKQIEAGAITKNTPIWKEGMSDWIPAVQSELSGSFKSAPPPRRPSLPPQRSSSTKKTTSAKPMASSFSKDTNMIYPRNPPQSPHLCWLNLFYPGIAQLTFGQIGKGIAYFVGFPIGCFLFLIPGIIIWIVSIADAMKVGKSLEAGNPVGKWQFFPSVQ